ncbi:MAG: hypothetical protein JO209_00910 [Acidisphaera sp.]|nr:hypothetical protein [Acidisphaera sp.]
MIERSELERRLRTRGWLFGRQDGSTIARAVRFARGGALQNHAHPNEARWRIREGCLEFLDRDQVVTTRFDAESHREDGRLLLSGRFLPIPEPEIRHMLEEEPPLGPRRPLPTPPRVAVIVRTHVIGEKLLDLLDCLSGSPVFDLFVGTDETVRPLPLPGFATLPHSVAMCREIGLSVRHDALLWQCGDYPLYCAVRQIPDYDYYLQLEYDVQLIRRTPLLIEGLVNRLDGADGPLDFLGALWGPAADDWMWTAAARRRYPVVYGGLFAFVMLSRRAVLHLQAERLAEAREDPPAEAVVHCEAFAGSALMAAGTFCCGAVADLLPGSVDPATFHPKHPDLSLPNYLLGAAIGDDALEIAHPVLDAPAYLAAALHAAAASRRIAAFVRHMQALPEALVEPALKARFLQEARALAATGD